MLDAVRRICIDFCTRSALLSEIIPLTLIANTKTYTITPTSAAEYPAKIRNVLVDELPLGKTNAESYPLLTERTENGAPKLFFAPVRNQITLAPIPNLAGTAEVDVVLRPARAATVVADVLYEEWATTIAMGTKSELMLMTGMTWANPELGAYYKTRYDMDIGTAGVEAATGNAGAAMRVASLEL